MNADSVGLAGATIALFVAGRGLENCCKRQKRWGTCQMALGAIGFVGGAYASIFCKPLEAQGQLSTFSLPKSNEIHLYDPSKVDPEFSLIEPSCGDGTSPKVEEIEIHAIAQGTVQGVNFRANTQRFATELGLKGSAQNLPDGSVEIYAQGKEETIEQLFMKLHKRYRPCNKEIDPDRGCIASISKDKVTAPNHYSDFNIIY